jgi:hypothetical protein
MTRQMLPETASPVRVIATRQATVISTPINPYSIAVVPASSPQN